MTLKDVKALLNIEQEKAGVFTEEGAIIKAVSEILPYLDECIVIRQNAVHRSGIPDLIVCYIGRFIGLELKDNTGVQSSQQKEWERKIKQAGGYYILADNMEPIINILNHIWNESVYSRCRSGI
jgi:hypothetical protein